MRPDVINDPLPGGAPRPELGPAAAVPTEAPSSKVNPVTGVVEQHPAPPARVVFSRDLLLGDQELHIDHDGAIYRLRVTQNGKLILYK